MRVKLVKSKKEKKKIGAILKDIKLSKPFLELAEYSFINITYPIYNKYFRKDRYGIMYSSHNSPFRFDGPEGPTEDFVFWYQKGYKTLEEALTECEKFEKEAASMTGKAVLYDIFKKEAYKPPSRIFELYEPEYKTKQ